MIKEYINLYIKIISQDIKGKLSYRADFVISTLGMILGNVVGFLTIWIMFGNVTEICGWNYYEILFFYGFSLMAITPSQCCFDNNWNLQNAVITGDFIKYCTMPLNTFFYFFAETFDIKGIGQFVLGIVIVVLSLAKLGASFNVFTFGCFIVMWIAASICMISIMTLASAVNFYVAGGSSDMLTLLFKTKDYAKYPITIYNSFVKFIFTYVIPIGFIAYYPGSLILRGRNAGIMPWITMVVAFVFFFISYKIWIYGARNYFGTGS